MIKVIDTVAAEESSCYGSIVMEFFGPVEICMFFMDVALEVKSRYVTN